MTSPSRSSADQTHLPSASIRPSPAMGVMEAITRRRSVRNYANKTLGRTVLFTLLKSATCAPKALNTESLAYVLIQDKETLRELSEHSKELLRNETERHHFFDDSLKYIISPEFNIFYNAGTLVTIYGRPLGSFVPAESWLAAQNIMLAARSMELGTCLIGLAIASLNTSHWKKKLNVPEEMIAYAPIIVGVLPNSAEQEGPSPGRSDPKILFWE